jgi:hypothetical protein
VSASASPAAQLWSAYGEHAAVLFGAGPSPTAVLGERSLFVSSGAPHVDLNQAALFGGAGRAEASELARLADLADVPVLLGCSSTVEEDLSGPLREAGFGRLPTTECLFWMRGVPQALTVAPFAVRRMSSAADIAAMEAMFEEVHGYDPGVTHRLFGRMDPSDDRSSCWMAWDEGEPVSLAFVTHAGSSLALWEVMTPPRHRRRGAARAVTVEALNSVARRVGGVERTLFWSSPAGRPLYDALGFEIADTVEVWARGASPADLAAVGAG